MAVAAPRTTPAPRLGSQHAAIALLALAPFVWGLALPATKVALETVDVAGFLAWSRVLGTVTLAGALVGCGRARLLADRRLIVPGLALGGLLFAALMLQTLGLERTSATNTGFITGLYVVLVPVLGIALHASQGARRALPAVPVAVLGIGLLSLDGVAPRAGDLLVLASALALAVHVMALAHWAPRFDPLALAAAQLAASTVLHVSLLAQSGADVGAAASIWPLLLLNGVLGSGVAYLVQIAAQQRVDASRTAVVLCLEAMVGAVCSALWLGERLGPREWAGAALLLAAVAISELRAQRAGGAPEPPPRGGAVERFRVRRAARAAHREPDRRRRERRVDDPGPPGRGTRRRVVRRRPP
jgi:drug/metabolite transporter (DMT)-like permease